MLLLPTILFCILGILSYFKPNKFALYSKLLSIFMLFFMGFIITYRFGLGADYFSYQNIYASITKTSITSALTNYNKIEIGYIFLMFIFKNLNVPYHLFTIIINTITVGIFIAWIYIQNTGKDKVFNIFLYYTMFFFVWGLSTYRQSLAISIVLILFFNDRVVLSPVKQILFVLALSLLHQSVLVLFVYFIFERILRNKKSYAVLFMLAIISAMLPVHLIAEALSDFKIFRLILTYVDAENLSILTFSSLMRAFFFLFFYTFYDNFMSESKSVQKIYKFHLIGYIIFFFLSFSQLTAARASIYSYITFVILFPFALRYMVEFLKEKKITIFRYIPSPIFTFMIILLFSLFSINKEVSALEFQTGYMNNLTGLNIPNVISKDYSEFASDFSFVEERKYIYTEKYYDFINENYEKLEETSVYVFNKDDSYRAVFNSNDKKYYIINQNGELVITGGFNYRPEIYGSFYSVINSSAGKSNLSYKNIDPENEGTITQAIIESNQYGYDIKTQVKYHTNGSIVSESQSSSFDNLLEKYRNHNPKINGIITQTKPFKYHAVELQIYNQNYYVYLDDDLKVISENLFDNVQIFDSSGFISIRISNTSYIFNSEFQLIWIEEI